MNQARRIKRRINRVCQENDSESENKKHHINQDDLCDLIKDQTNRMITAYI